MTPSRALLVLWSALGCGLLHAQQSEAVFQVTGVAVSSRDGAPIPFCQLRVTPARIGPRVQPSIPGRRPGARGNAGRERSRIAPSGEEAISADVHGRFRITLPKGGAWELTGMARGFHRQALEEHDGYSEAIVLSEAVPVFAAKLRLDPDATMSGSVFDEAGEPVSNARVSIYAADASEPGAASGRAISNAQTDDRGRYELAMLPPGIYRLEVQARPWYAEGANGGRRGRGPGSVVTPSVGATADPSLDMVYAATWFPGTDEERHAGVITLAGGEERQADFHLQPIAAGKAVLARPPAQESGEPQRRESRIWDGPFIERMTAAGREGISGSQQMTPDGWVVSSLQPGTYQVRMAERDGGVSSDVRQFVVRAGGGEQVNLASAESLVNVKLLFAGSDGDDVRVSLTDSQTGFQYNEERDLRRYRTSLGRDDANSPETHFIAVPAGAYLVSAEGGNGQYLANITATGAEVSGRRLQVAGGTPAITLTMEDGRGIVSGFVRKDSLGLAGAMVLLVPAVSQAADLGGDPSRDESNSDGSFLMTNVVPGRYILVAIEQGWKVNWRDPDTLAGYLVHGVPLEVRPRETIKTEVAGVAP